MPIPICDACRFPGACCREIPLTLSFWDDEDIHAVWPDLREAYRDSNGFMPFTPVRVNPQVASHLDPASGRTYSSWLFSCAALLPNGRCGVYDQRPHCCKSYEPHYDRLCVMRRLKPAEPGEPKADAP